MIQLTKSWLAIIPLACIAALWEVAFWLDPEGLDHALTSALNERGWYHIQVVAKTEQVH